MQNLQDLDTEGALAVAAGALQGIPEPQLLAFESEKPYLTSLFTFL